MKFLVKNTDNKIVIVYLLTLIITFLGVYNYIYDTKIDFNGDNASYFILGKSIASGNGYKNIDNVNKPAHGHFPPGYPLIVSAVLSAFPSDIQAVKKVNGFFFLASVVLFFFIANKLIGNIHLSFAVSMLLLFNANFLQFSTIMMSEMAFQAITFASMLLFLSSDLKKSVFRNRFFMFAIFLAVFAFYIRSLGLGLIGGICLYLIYNKKWSYLIFSVLAFVTLMIPWQIRNHHADLNKSGYVSQFLSKNPYRLEDGTLTLDSWGDRVYNNFERYMTKEIPIGLFSFKDVSYKNDPSHLDWAKGFIILILIVYGLFKSTRYQLFFLLYFASVLAILLNWPDVWKGPRFIFQLLPFFLLFIFYGIYHVAARKQSKSKEKVAIAIVWIFAIVSIRFYWPMVKEYHRRASLHYSGAFRNYIELAKWVNENLGPEEVVNARKPGFFYLHSNRYVSMQSRSANREKVLEDMVRAKTTYVVVDRLGYSSTSRYLLPAIKKYPYKFKEVAKVGDPATYLLKFRSNLGYKGAFDANEKREGHGTFTWENGQVYDGMWKNGQRNGHGTLTLPDGRMLQGEWVNDRPAQGTLFNEYGEPILISRPKNQ